MLRQLMEMQYKWTEKGTPFHRFRPLVASLDSFFFEPNMQTTSAPHIRDAVDVKRWMILVVFALLPCCLMAIWNTGLQKMVYSSSDAHLMQSYLDSLDSLESYFSFCFAEGRWQTILWLGALAFFPVVLISYMVGGLVEMIFAVWRGHELAEGFLVTGILYPLVLPPTIPYWMVAVGVAVGIFLSKEVFGGTGHNIMNPALACRAFLFFTFPAKMSGDVWVGTNPTVVRNSLQEMNQTLGLTGVEGFTQASALMKVNAPHEVKRIHIDAIASNALGKDVSTFEQIQAHFAKWTELGGEGALGDLNLDQMQAFVTSSLDKGGLGLDPGLFENAYQLSGIHYGLGPLNSDWSFFFGNKLGCMGETSVLAALLGAFFIIWTGVGSWRTMVAVCLGVVLTALSFNLFAHFVGADGGAWNTASFAFPFYKHFLIGGLAFGLVFMATDPVSSSDLKGSQWIYGIFIGIVTVVIRLINPAYPEGVMLAILMGNVFHPLFDAYAAKFSRRRYRAVQANL